MDMVSVTQTALIIARRCLRYRYTPAKTAKSAKTLFFCAFLKDLLVVLESFCNFAAIRPASPRGWVGQDMLIRTFT